MDPTWLNIANLIAIIFQVAVVVIGGIFVLAKIKATNESLTATLIDLKTTIKEMQLEHKQITRQQIQHDVRIDHLEAQTKAN